MHHQTVSSSGAQCVLDASGNREGCLVAARHGGSQRTQRMNLAARHRGAACGETSECCRRITCWWLYFDGASGV